MSSSYPDKKQLKDIFQWDVASWSRALPLWKEHLPKTGMALALGERDGGLSLWLAQQDLHVHCTDLEGPTDNARNLHEEYEEQRNITYDVADITNLPYADASFDVVVFKSVLGALETKERQQQALDEIFRVLKPGGKLLFAENLRGSALHRWARKKFVKWATYWRYLNLKADADIWKNYDLQWKTTGFLAAFGRSEGQRKFLAAVDMVFTAITPKTMHYILYGVAVKGSETE